MHVLVGSALYYAFFSSLIPPSPTLELKRTGQVTFADWGAKKASTRWGQMPMLQIEGGAEMAQTKAIAKFLAKQVRSLAARHSKYSI